MDDREITAKFPCVGNSRVLEALAAAANVSAQPEGWN